MRTLLNQTSGLRDYTDVLSDFDRPTERSALVKAIGDVTPAFAPNTAWAYSNSNYILLGWLIEATSGQSYADYIKERVFDRAGLPSARPDLSIEIISGRAEPYELDGQRFVHQQWLDPNGSHSADGGVLFASQDVAPWWSALSRHRLVSRSSWQAALSPSKSAEGNLIPYGFGWFLDRVNGRACHWHTGGVPGYGAILVCIPELELAVAVMTNRSGNGSALRALAWTALEEYAPGSTHLGLAAIKAHPVDGIVRNVLSSGKDLKPDPRLIAPELLNVYASPLTRPRAVQKALTSFELSPIEQYRVEGCTMRRYRITDPVRSRAMLAGFDKDNRLFWLGSS